MSNGAYAYYKDLPPWAKAIVIIGGGTIAVIVGVSVWNIFKKALNPAATNLKEPKDAATQVGNLAANGITPTMTDAQLQGYVNDLVQAMGGCSTTHATLETVFSNMNNDADIYKLIALFGTQDISGCLWWGGGNMSLSQAISAEVNAGEIATINGILAAKKINYTFS